MNLECGLYFHQNISFHFAYFHFLFLKKMNDLHSKMDFLHYIFQTKIFKINDKFIKFITKIDIISPIPKRLLKCLIFKR